MTLFNDYEPEWLAETYKDVLKREIAQLSGVTSVDSAVEILLAKLPMELSIGGTADAYFDALEEAPLEWPSFARRGDVPMSRPVIGKLFVPYVGSEILLGIEVPNASQSDYLLRTETHRGNLLALKIESPTSPTAVELESLRDEWIRLLQESAKHANAKLKAISEQMRADLTASLTERFGALQRFQSLKESLQIPIRTTQKQIPLQVQRKEIRVVEKVESEISAPIANYMLGGEIYEDIMRTLVAMSRSMEKTPLTTSDLDEEDIRNIILFVLNANYEGSVHGEVFTAREKTDILLTHMNYNAFIAECKFWHGRVKFHEALEQLLGYLVWRDSKAALLLFIRQSDAAAIIEKAAAAVKSHRSFVDVVSEDRESGSFRYTVRSIRDQSRLITLALVPVVVTVKGDTALAIDKE